MHSAEKKKRTHITPAMPHHSTLQWYETTFISRNHHRRRHTFISPNNLCFLFNLRLHLDIHTRSHKNAVFLCVRVWVQRDFSQKPWITKPRDKVTTLEIITRKSNAKCTCLLIAVMGCVWVYVRVYTNY